MDRLEELKTKYRSALDSMPQAGIQVTQVKLQNDKLFVEGYAPDVDAKNQAWNAIKAIDGAYADLTCDIKIGAAPEKANADGSPQSLAEGLAAAFRSDQTPAFPSMLSNLFSNSSGQQRAGLLNQLLASAGPGLLGGALSGPLASILKGGNTVTPEQAEKIPAESIEHLAAQAEKSNPSIIEQVSSFYSQHPQLVQALGAGALAMIMTHRRQNN